MKDGDDLTFVEAVGGTEEGDDELFRSEVVVRRHGGAAFPVEVLFVFEDGHELRRRWGGRRRWQLFVEEYTARLDYAVIDPDGVLALDILPSNNSREVEPQPDLPAWKWAARWTVWLEDFFSTFAFFV